MTDRNYGRLFAAAPASRQVEFLQGALQEVKSWDSDCSGQFAFIAIHLEPDERHELAVLLRRLCEHLEPFKAVRHTV